MFKIYKYILTLLVPAFSSCGTMGSHYDVVHKNVGQENLDHVSVSYGKFKSVCGYLGAGFESHHSFVNEEEAIPEEAKVDWIRIRDGKRFEKMLKIKSKLPKGRFSGDIIFLLNDNDVELTWKKK